MASEDETLWERIKQTISPLNREDVLPDTVFPSINKKPKKTRYKKKESSRFAPNTGKNISQTPPRFAEIDRQTQRKWDKGTIKTDGKLDLHGRTVAQAHQDFRDYILQAVVTGKKHLIIVTGKGSKEKGTGKIRRELPFWAQEPEIAQHIHAFSEPVKNQGRYLISLRAKKNRTK